MRNGRKVKLDAYGFDKNAIKLVNSYLSNRKQIYDKFSSWSEILYGLPQGSISGPSLFHVFICDMFYFLKEFDITNFACDFTPYNTDKNIEFVVNKCVLLSCHVSDLE